MSGNPDTEGDVRLVVGVMSGTSIDSLDAALVRIHGQGLSIKASLVRHISTTLGALGPPLRKVAEQRPVTAGQLASLAWRFGELHADTIKQLLRDEHEMPHIICVHGQTVYHRPPISFQLINAAPIAARWPTATVISGLRQLDLACGGQGAPITPLADWVLFRSSAASRAVVNLGGFCNVTIVPKEVAKAHDLASLEPLQGADVCSCNHLLDWVARERLGAAFDEGGATAMRGTWHGPLRTSLQHGKRVVRSMGTGDEELDTLKDFSALPAEDMLASICAAIADNISVAVGNVDDLILAGGGARNVALVEAIRRQSPRKTVVLSDAYGVPVQARESIAMAILGALHSDGIPVTLSHITGRRDTAVNPAPDPI